MLILTRKSGEGIRIGDHITIKIIEIRGNQVRVGIQAPKDLSVHREEIYALIQDQNRAAAQSSPANPELLSAVFKDKNQKSAGKKKNPTP